MLIVTTTNPLDSISFSCIFEKVWKTGVTFFIHKTIQAQVFQLVKIHFVTDKNHSLFIGLVWFYVISLVTFGIFFSYDLFLTSKLFCLLAWSFISLSFIYWKFQARIQCIWVISNPYPFLQLLLDSPDTNLSELHVIYNFMTYWDQFLKYYFLCVFVQDLVWPANNYVGLIFFIFHYMGPRDWTGINGLLSICFHLSSLPDPWVIFLQCFNFCNVLIQFFFHFQFNEFIHQFLSNWKVELCIFNCWHQRNFYFDYHTDIV